MHNYWVYILTNMHNAVLYIGMTNDIVRRVREHREGKGSAFARKYRTTKLVYCEHATEVDAAIRREKELKSWRQSKKIELIESTNPTWRDLAEDFLE